MAAPTVTSVTPSTGNAGTTVLVVGTGFSGVTSVTIGGATADFEVSSTTLLAATTPTGSGASQVVVTNADGSSSDAVNFTYSDATVLFTEAELRAFNGGKLADAVKYPTGDYTTVEARIRAQFTDICGVHFIPTSTTEYLDGDGTDTIWVTWPQVTAITAAVLYATDGTISETFDATDLSDVAVYSNGCLVRKQQGTWLKGNKNCCITYTNGHTTVPADIKRAALVVALTEMTFTNISDRTTSFSDGAMTFQLATAGKVDYRGNISYYGLPLVDEVLRRYKQFLPGVS